MENEDIQKELDSLWQRVTEGPTAGGPPSLPPSGFSGPADVRSMTSEASLAAITLIKRQHRDELMRLQQLVELKERTVRELTDRLSTAERENDGLHRKSQRDEQRIYQEVFDVTAELESAQKALRAQEEKFAEEEKVLRGIAEQTRRQLAAENQRWRELERQWTEREQQYLLDIRELQTRSQQSWERSSRFEGQARKSSDELKEAKKAIESTLAELVQERTERDKADKERDKALTRVKEVEEHFQELQNIWEEERKQWQELWDRERSTWETQRQEFASWEAKVRSEREQWHDNLRKVERRETRYAEHMSEVMHKAAEAGDKVSSVLRAATERAKEIAGLKAKAQKDIEAELRPKIQRRLFWSPRRIAAAAAAALLLAVSYPLYKHLNRLDFEPLASYSLDVENPTGMVYDGDVLMLSKWNGSLVSLDPRDPSSVVGEYKVRKAGAYHPISLALWGDTLYSLDSAQGRILAHTVIKPQEIAVQWESPGPAPIALAHDGQNLWSYDAATRSVYRHLGEGAQAHADAFSVGLDILPSAMAWHRDRLWIYDAKGRQILVFRVEGKSLKLVRSAPFKTPVQAMTLTYRATAQGGQRFELWALSIPASGPAGPSLKKFRVLRGD